MAAIATSYLAYKSLTSSTTSSKNLRIFYAKKTMFRTDHIEEEKKSTTKTKEVNLVKSDGSEEEVPILEAN